jgi:hypothetical protein
MRVSVLQKEKGEGRRNKMEGTGEKKGRHRREEKGEASRKRDKGLGERNE